MTIGDDGSIFPLIIQQSRILPVPWKIARRRETIRRSGARRRGGRVAACRCQDTAQSRVRSESSYCARPRDRPLPTFRHEAVLLRCGLVSSIFVRVSRSRDESVAQRNSETPRIFPHVCASRTGTRRPACRNPRPLACARCATDGIRFAGRGAGDSPIGTPQNSARWMRRLMRQQRR